MVVMSKKKKEKVIAKERGICPNCGILTLVVKSNDLLVVIQHQYIKRDYLQCPYCKSTFIIEK